MEFHDLYNRQRVVLLVGFLWIFCLAGCSGDSEQRCPDGDNCEKWEVSDPAPDTSDATDKSTADSDDVLPDSLSPDDASETRSKDAPKTDAEPKDTAPDGPEVDADNTDPSPDSEANECPKAVAQARVESEGRPSTNITTIPLKTVRLDASRSTDPDGRVQRYKWTLVEQPEGSTARLLPDNTSKRPKLYLDLTGEYKVELTVFDAEGQKSCKPSTVTIKAVPEDDIHVQLVWDTPKDPDQTNECGADLDLHYLHENGSWNDEKWDIFFKNKTADWGEPGTDDDPEMDIDDINGKGPESIFHNNPTPGVNYTIGVHYYRATKPDSDLGGVGMSCPENEPDEYGTSYATVKVFLDGVLAQSFESTPLKKQGQFWEVAKLEWPSGEVTGIDTVHDKMPE